MSDYDVLEILNKYFSKIKEKNPAFSLRALAKKVEISPSYLTQILNGKRRLSKSNAEKILKALGVNKYKRLELISDIETSSKRSSNLKDDRSASNKLFFQNSLETYRDILLASGNTVMSLIDLDDFRDDPNWVYEKSGVPPETYEWVRGELFKIGIFKMNSLGNIVGTKKFVATDLKGEEFKEVSLNSAKNAARDAYLDIERKLSSSPGTPSTGWTAINAIDPSLIEELKELIYSWRGEFAGKASKIKSGKTELYRASFFLHPITYDVDESTTRTGDFDMKAVITQIDRKKIDKFEEECKNEGLDFNLEIQKVVEDLINKKIDSKD